MRRVRGGGRFGPLLMAAAVVGCGGARDPGSDRRDAPAPVVDTVPDGPAIVNDAWQIVRMATAHGVITLEVEVDDVETGGDVARELIAPLEGGHDEVLVYIYRVGQGTGGNTPVMRARWTPGGGYEELDYGRNDP